MAKIIVPPTYFWHLVCRELKKVENHSYIEMLSWKIVDGIWSKWKGERKQFVFWNKKKMPGFTSVVAIAILFLFVSHSLGVNFTNVLPAAFSLVDPESVNKCS